MEPILLILFHFFLSETCFFCLLFVRLQEMWSMMKRPTKAEAATYVFFCKVGCIPRHLDPRDAALFVPYHISTAITANHDEFSYSNKKNSQFSSPTSSTATTPPGCSFWDDKFNASRNKVPKIGNPGHCEVISTLCQCFFGGKGK